MGNNLTSWCRHIVSILLDKCRGIGTENVGWTMYILLVNSGLVQILTRILQLYIIAFRCQNDAVVNCN